MYRRSSLNYGLFHPCNFKCHQDSRQSPCRLKLVVCWVSSKWFFDELSSRSKDMKVSSSASSSFLCTILYCRVLQNIQSLKRFLQIFITNLLQSPISTFHHQFSKSPELIQISLSISNPPKNFDSFQLINHSNLPPFHRRASSQKRRNFPLIVGGL
jgi:hypothetical protein